MNSTSIETVQQFCLELTTELNPEAVYQRAVNFAGQFVKQSNIGLFLLDGATLGLKLAATGYQPYFEPGYQQPAGDGIIGRVAATGSSYLVDDVWLEPDYVPAHQQSQTRSQYCFPLIKSGAVVGVLDIQSRRAAACTAGAAQTLEWAAGFMAAAICTALSVRNLEQQLELSHETERELRTSEQMLKDVVASISAHIYVTEVTSDGQLINHYISPNVEALTGFAHQEFINDWSFWPARTIYPPDKPIADKQFQQLLSGHTSTTEYRLNRADGQLIWVRDSGQVERRGASRIIYGVVTDISDRKQIEQALIQERALLARRVSERTSELSLANAQLARAARLKDEFLANISHELRTPLNAILGMAEILQTEIYGPLNSEQHRTAAHIDESGRHLLALITDILDLSKIEAQKLELQIGQTYIDSICEASLRMVHQSALKKHITIKSEIDNRVETIQADPRRVKQILVNLLSNAVKFTPAGGQIGLYVRGDQHGGRVNFTVWDTGVGIAPDDIGRLFEPFVQLDSNLARQHEGSGLGLSLVAKLAELHNGSVSVQSNPGTGSRFIVSLPWQETLPHPKNGTNKVAALEPAAAPRLPAGNGAQTNKPLVLLVEDNEANLITLTEFLRGVQYRVVVARTGIEALERVKEDEPNIVLMDIQMPDMDGLEATRKIRANPKLHNLPIIALTALAMPGDREQCLSAGVNEYLSKPVSLRSLLEIMQVQLQKKNSANGVGVLS